MTVGNVVTGYGVSLATSATYTVVNASAFLQVRLVRADGTDYPLVADALPNVSIFFSNAQVPAPTSITGNTFRSELIDEGQVASFRCTAMSMLTTNMAAPIEAGGELVVARTRESILSNLSPPVNVAGLMTAIKNLPEQLYWRSGNIADGGYSWYLPDDMSSYEPGPVDSTSSNNNILISAGVMSSANGYVRVTCTWCYEFYTPRQVFDRKYTQMWSPIHHELFERLVHRPAVSANVGHGALIASLVALASQVYAAYKKYEDIIDPIAIKALSVVSKRITNPPKEKEKQKQKPPPLPPRPKKL